MLTRHEALLSEQRVISTPSSEFYAIVQPTPNQENQSALGGHSEATTALFSFLDHAYPFATNMWCTYLSFPCNTLSK